MLFNNASTYVIHLTHMVMGEDQVRIYIGKLRSELRQ